MERRPLNTGRRSRDCGRRLGGEWCVLLALFSLVNSGSAELPEIVVRCVSLAPNTGRRTTRRTVLKPSTRQPFWRQQLPSGGGTFVASMKQLIIPTSPSQKRSQSLDVMFKLEHSGKLSKPIPASLLLRFPTVKMLTCLLTLLLIAPLFADEKEEKSESKIDSSLLSAFKLRSIGPAFMSGRVADIAVDPENENTWYVAVGSGNLWKTKNSGTTWRPIFDNYGSYSIGCVTIDPNNHNVIWVGTGEAVGGRHVGFGDGVYVSRDGGGRFKNLGLKETEHIAKIVVDPRDSDVVYVAAQGPLWSPGGQRGLYRTKDGGESWQAILTKGEYTGCTDVAIDPRNPDIVFAVMHQRHRTVWSLINGGPESGIFKSTDGGKNWRELTSGLPGGDKGKIAIAISPQKPDVMYATIELAGREGGFWRSSNGGESWSKQDDYVSGGTGPHYYQEIWCDPHRFDVVYQANVRLGRTEDGGKNVGKCLQSCKTRG